MTIKHATAGAFVFTHVSGFWTLGLILHPRLDRWMIPGGHVELDENVEAAARREILEETGVEVSVLPTPAALPLPSGYPHPTVAAAWWITEVQVSADSHVTEPHVHIDHQYVAIAADITPQCTPAHEVHWFSRDELQSVAMFEDTRILAKALFDCIDDLAAGASRSCSPWRWRVDGVIAMHQPALRRAQITEAGTSIRRYRALHRHLSQS
ncbi:NUDIX domain-containing protein [Catellatospora sp. NPDC049111]|uniref:NUDIX hydrolase n=1 Tax=Catellatospora sp. NPDC049111 TaxID=3155271 RepID=UPI003411B768